jgi:hypothetical protein
MFILTLLIALLSIEVGHRVGGMRRVAKEHEDEPPVGAMVAATLGLLAFLLAFTFGLAAQRFDARRQLVLDESNAIGTTWLRAAMLPERGDEIRGLLRQYVDARLQAAVEPDHFSEARHRSEQLQNQLWEHATAVARANPNSPVVALFVQSLNDVIDLHAKRMMAATQNRIPVAIWSALYLVAVLSLAVMGYHTGVVGKSRSLAMVAVAITFSAVLLLIADLDRPREGSLTVSQQSMIELRESMKPPTTQP